MTSNTSIASVQLTKAGKLKSRFSLREKLSILDPHSPVETTLKRIDEYQALFAFRFTDAIITKAGKGPRAWTKLSGKLNIEHIVRHLMANLITTQTPRWVGARSLATTRFFCIDVDADRTKEQILAEQYDTSRMDEDDKAWALSTIQEPTSRPPFAERCHQVESALRRLGINPNNPRHTLVQRTPRGGHHYYVFLDSLYHLDQITGILEQAGLTHVPGEVELYPSQSQGLRLPFGFLPGTAHDPTAWIQFIDDYKNRRIRRFSLAELFEHLGSHRSRHAARIASQRSKKSTATPSARPLTSRSCSLSQPRAKQPGQEVQRYEELLTQKKITYEQAEELIQLGIRQPGTRTIVLKHLACHLIWHKHHSALEAAYFLTNWANDERHQSTDIQNDITNGTQKVASQIEKLCTWYEIHLQSTPSTRARRECKFAHKELAALGQAIQNLQNPDERKHQAQFLLHFLAYAKMKGQATPEGWLASPAIRAVIRRWPGCHHMNYQTRVNHAVRCNILHLTRRHWHNRFGQGRAQTYCLSVPQVDSQSECMNYEAALEFLVSFQLGESDHHESPDNSIRTEQEKRHELTQIPKTSNLRANPAYLCPARSRINLEADSCQRHPQWHATSDLYRNNLGTIKATAEAYTKLARFLTIRNSRLPGLRRTKDCTRTTPLNIGTSFEYPMYCRPPPQLKLSNRHYGFVRALMRRQRSIFPSTNKRP